MRTLACPPAPRCPAPFNRSPLPCVYSPCMHAAPSSGCWALGVTPRWRAQSGPPCSSWRRVEGGVAACGGRASLACVRGGLPACLLRLFTHPPPPHTHTPFPPHPLQEYADGGSVKSLLMRQMQRPHSRLYTLSDALQWSTQVAEGLSCLHEFKPKVGAGGLGFGGDRQAGAAPRSTRFHTPPTLHAPPSLPPPHTHTLAPTDHPPRPQE